MHSHLIRRNEISDKCYFCVSCNIRVKADEVVTLESPDKSIELTVLVAEGQLKYNVIKGESVIVGDLELDLTTSDGHENETYREGNGCFWLLDVDL